MICDTTCKLAFMCSPLGFSLFFLVLFLAYALLLPLFYFILFLLFFTLTNFVCKGLNQHVTAAMGRRQRRGNDPAVATAQDPAEARAFGGQGSRTMLHHR